MNPISKPSRRRDADALELAQGNQGLVDAVQRSRALLKRRAFAAAAAGAVPLPGFDWAVDAAMLTQLLPRINAQFGLAPAQIEKLDAKEKERLQKAVAVVGSLLVGRLITRGMVLRFAQLVGMRLTAAQAAKFVPLAGQLVSGFLGYTAIRYLGEQHIRDCVKIVQAMPLLLPHAESPALARRSQTGTG